MADQLNASELCAERLASDPRIAQAKKLLLEAVKEHQNQLTGIKVPHPLLKLQYDDNINAFSEYRGAKLFYPYLGSGIGKGALVELLDGSVKYDFISGIGPMYYGHSHPDIIGLCIDAAISDIVMEGNLQQNRDAMDLSELLLKASGLDHCFLTTSGAMANENALKIAFQKRYPANRILAFEGCFMGRTYAMSLISDKAMYREGLPCNLMVDYIPFYDNSSPEESIQQSVEALQKIIRRYPKQHAIMCFELIQGEGGFYPGTKQFFEALMQILKKNAIAILIDEIQTFGRTSKLFAYQHFGLEEYVDIATIGKLSQVCATLFTDQYKPLPALLSQSFTGSTSAIRSGKFIIQSFLDGNFLGVSGMNMQIQHYFRKKFEDIAERHPGLIQGPYGLGAMIAFTPLSGNIQIIPFLRDLFDAGVIAFFAGKDLTRVRLLVPVAAITFADIDEVINIIEAVLLKTAQDSSCS